MADSDAAPRSGRDLALFQGISPTFVAKILAKLEKAGIVRAAEGLRGGYLLAGHLLRRLRVCTHCHKRRHRAGYKYAYCGHCDYRHLAALVVCHALFPEYRYHAEAGHAQPAICHKRNSKNGSNDSQTDAASNCYPFADSPLVMEKASLNHHQDGMALV